MRVAFTFAVIFGLLFLGYGAYTRAEKTSTTNQLLQYDGGIPPPPPPGN